MRFVFLFVVACFLANGAAAQNYPAYQDIYVNDYAGLLSESAEAQLRSELETLREDTGVEMSVLTLRRRNLFAGSDVSLEAFATGLFNHWGIGDRERNDGVLVMVLREDREMRVELGAGYGRDWDDVAQRVIDRSFLPAFKAADYEKGILEGSRDVIGAIVLPFREGAPAPKKDKTGLWVGLGIFGGFAALILGAMRIPHLLAARKHCPACGQRGMTLSKRVLIQPTNVSMGTGEKTLTCKHCGHSETTQYSIASRSQSRSSGGSGGFGGGRSGGGGASGRW